MPKKRPNGRIPEVGSYWILRANLPDWTSTVFKVLGIANKPVDPRFPHPVIVFFRNDKGACFTMPANNWHPYFTEKDTQEW